MTPSPLTERMTLFWHNHFVSGQPKVRVSRLMYRQNVTLRANAAGNFGVLLHAIAKDPAMLVYLDSAQNRKGAPNENFAREVMELFTLGEGHYTEQDVKEAARAFTGWSLDRETRSYVFRPRLHDAGMKTVLGKSGPLRRRRRARPPARATGDRAARDGEALARVRLARSRCGGSEAHRRALSRIELRHQGRVARAPALRRVLRRARIAACSSSRRPSSSSARCASFGLRPDGRCRSRSRRRHGAEPDVAAQRQRLARRRDVDQHDDAPRAEAVRRSR